MSNFETALALLSSTTASADGSGAVVDLGVTKRLLRQTLSVTAAAGALNVTLEASADGATAWRPFGTFSPTLGPTTEKLTFISPERYVRVSWKTATSTTLAVAGAVGIVYANLDDFDRFGLPAGTASGFTRSTLAEALAAASVDADGKLALRADLPLVSWGADLSRRVCQIAAYEVMSARGFNPDTGSDTNIRMRFDDAWKWLTAYANGHVNSKEIVDSTPEDDDDGPDISAYPTRGW